MTLVEFEEMLAEVLDGISPNFNIVVNEDGEVVIYTSLGIGDDEELFELDTDDESDFMDDEDVVQLEEEDDDED